MPYADPQKQRAAQSKWLAANRPQNNDAKRRMRQRNALVVMGAKEVPCMDCGVRYPHYVMDLDHRDGADKVSNVSLLVNRAVSVERLQAEIDKCDVVCSNCHRERTWKSRDGERYTL